MEPLTRILKEMAWDAMSTWLADTGAWRNVRAATTGAHANVPAAAAHHTEASLLADQFADDFFRNFVSSIRRGTDKAAERSSKEIIAKPLRAKKPGLTGFTLGLVFVQSSSNASLRSFLP
ncbi:MAG: hypothetical protein LBT14_00310 [Treponema sp.]|jgi:hypothetical protein|nr:hypothetical protein [Treponema sp.]